MAAEKTLKTTELQIKSNTGELSETGKEILRTRNYGRIKDEATAQNILDTATAIVNLQDYAVLAINVVELSEVVDGM